MLYAAAISLHLLAVVIWVGGMFFAYMALRPVAASLLEPPQRLNLWVQSFAKFFPWVWLSILILYISGFWMIETLGGFAQIQAYIHSMLGLGSVMSALFAYVYFLPYRAMKQAVILKDYPVAAKQLARIRLVIAINLSLGLLTVIVATAGHAGIQLG